MNSCSNKEIQSRISDGYTGLPPNSCTLCKSHSSSQNILRNGTNCLFFHSYFIVLFEILTHKASKRHFLRKRLQKYYSISADFEKTKTSIILTGGQGRPRGEAKNEYEGIGEKQCFLPLKVKILKKFIKYILKFAQFSFSLFYT